MAVTFNLKRPKNNIPTSIYARFIYSKNDVKYYIRESINPKFWDFKTQRAKKTRENPQYLELNALINKLESELETIFRNLRNDLAGRFPTPSELKKAINERLGTSQSQAKADPTNTWSGYFEHFINLSANGMRGALVKPSTLQVYRKTLDHLNNFEKYNKLKLSFDNIDQEFYASFVGYLRNEKNLSNNTIGKQIKTIKTVLRHALEAKKHNNRDFESKSFKTLNEEAESIYLTEDELMKIESLDLSQNLTLDKVRDAFLVGCYTGLRYSDYSDFKMDNIRNGYIE
ncbi:MAG: site-specific integrase [Saprospiraceae bacterium]|nr:site-specific integrase [Saprospiraceae bacterium]